MAEAANDQPPAQEVTPDKWPRTSDIGGAKCTIYQPQLDSWDGFHFTARAAVSVLPAGAHEPIFGVLDVTAVTEVDRLSRVVDFSNVEITSSNFPSAPDQANQFQKDFQTILSSATFAPSLDRMESALAIEKAQSKSRGVPVNNPVPKFIFSQTPAVLVHIDGEPVWRNVEGTKLVRVLNTRALILGDESGKVYIHILDGFLGAPTLSGPWTGSQPVPAGASEVAQELAKKNVVDLMEGPPDEKTKKRPSLKNGAPQVIVATTPTELVVTEGPPDWVPITNTSLLYVKNTTGNIFKSLEDQSTYVLVTGRWFRAPDFGGPWQYVEGNKLPSDFSSIPDDSPKENVKASVPGTPQAQEAVIANAIPQTARVDRTTATFTPQISGDPQLKPIPDTKLRYVFNSPTPIIRVSPNEWYALQSGIWFTSSSLSGPWAVATSVPAKIYSIPPSSPVYYVTYVKVYDVTPQYVVVGYTPGYMGTIVTSDGVVVYGTGYTYPPYIGTTVWYGQPLTYGYAANPTWTPWTGWIIGFGLGWAAATSTSAHYYYCYPPAPYWGPMPYSPYAGYARGPHGGAAVWGPSGWAATTGNVYQKWGPRTAISRSSTGYNAWTGNAWSSRVGTSYNSTTGRISAGQQAAVKNVYTGNYAYGQRGATYNPNTGVSARGGSATVGNVASGSQESAKWRQVQGPGGQSTSAAKVGDDLYAGHDGNVYKNTGDGWKKYDNGSWNEVQQPSQASQTKSETTSMERKGTTQGARQTSTESLDAQRQARLAGDQRSASSSWGSRSWGGGFDRGASAADGERFGGGGDRSFGSEKSWGGGVFGGGGRNWGGGFGGGRGRR